MSTTEQADIQIPDVPPMPVVTQFASRGIHLTLERVHPRRVVNPTTGDSHWTEGISYEFQDGVLLIYPDQDRIADKFDQATGQMLEQDALEWLRAHELYATDRGFWEVAPLSPDPTPTLTTVMQLAVAAGNPETRQLAEDRLVGIHEDEARTWARKTVLDACEVALAAIESQAELSEPSPPEAPAAVHEMAPPPPKPNPEIIGSRFTGESEHGATLEPGSGGTFREG